MDTQRGHIEQQAAALVELRTTQADGLQRLEVCLTPCIALKADAAVQRQHAGFARCSLLGCDAAIIAVFAAVKSTAGSFCCGICNGNVNCSAHPR